jgi:hypothetical protein
MRRIVFSMAAVAMALAMTATVALAAVTWHSGPLVVFSSDQTSATASGDGSGFGNQPAVATLTLHASVTYTCQNKGGAQAPGQNPVDATTSGSADLGNADHNGRGVFNFTVTFAPAATVPGKSIGCPNGNWIGVNPVAGPVTAAELSITQGSKTIYDVTWDSPYN